MPYIKVNPPQVYMCSPSWTLLAPPSPFHPSGSSQCTSPKHPVSCIEPGLATHFIHDIIHVSMPFSQIFPPSPFPTESIRPFYTSVSLLLSCTQELLIITCGNAKQYSYSGRQFSSFLQSQTYLTIWFSGHAPRYVPNSCENLCLYKNLM